MRKHVCVQVIYKEKLNWTKHLVKQLKNNFSLVYFITEEVKIGKCGSWFRIEETAFHLKLISFVIVNQILLAS